MPLGVAQNAHLGRLSGTQFVMTQLIVPEKLTHKTTDTKHQSKSYSGSGAAASGLHSEQARFSPWSLHSPLLRPPQPTMSPAQDLRSLNPVSIVIKPGPTGLQDFPNHLLLPPA